MNADERRREIMKILCRRRHETMCNLAHELGVSVRTIQIDIDALSLSEPIYTQTGKYTGGVYIVEGYSIDRIYMMNFQIDVLRKLYIASENDVALLSIEEKRILKDIISQYSRPPIYK